MAENTGPSFSIPARIGVDGVDEDGRWGRMEQEEAVCKKGKKKDIYKGGVMEKWKFQGKKEEK